MKTLFLTLILLFSCYESKQPIKENWYSQFVQRDKNIIKRTINLLIDTISVDTALNESYYDMGGYTNRKFNGEPELIEIRVDSILYNDDLTKCIAFVVFKHLEHPLGVSRIAYTVDTKGGVDQLVLELDGFLDECDLLGDLIDCPLHDLELSRCFLLHLPP